MGKSCDGMQTVQFAERRSYASRSRDRATLARLIEDYLSEIYIREEVVIHDDRGLARWGVDPEVFDLVYRGWKRIVVGETGVLIAFDED